MGELDRVVAGELLERLEALADPRDPRGVRHSFVSLLAVAVCAVLSGAKGWTEIGQFAAELTPGELARLKARPSPYTGRYTRPDESTIRRALQRVDVDELDRVVGRWLAEQISPDALERGAGDNDDADGGEDAGGGGLAAVAVDGKTLRGARQPDGSQVHLLAAIVHGRGTVLAQRQVPPTTNEISVFRSLLDQVDDLAGRVVTADALHTQAGHAEYLVAQRHADYVFTVKGNQPGLEAAISRLPAGAFSPSPPGDRPGARPG